MRCFHTNMSIKTALFQAVKFKTHTFYCGVHIYSSYNFYFPTCQDTEYVIEAKRVTWSEHISIFEKKRLLFSYCNPLKQGTNVPGMDNKAGNKI
jgi:hypothetical protein